MLRKCIFLPIVLVMIFSLFACGPATEAPIPTPSGQEVIFPDANLEAAIREKIGKPSDSIQQRDLEILSDLEAHGKGITDLTGLEYCANLTTLSLTNNLIGDISPLAQLTNLREIGLSMNHISDISPLASLSELNMLQLNSNNISDISSLSSLTNLEIIYLGDNRISDISALQSLVNLKQVGLFMNQIGEIAPLVLNPGIGAGDQVFLANNNLDLSAAAGDKQKLHYLIARGVVVDARGQEYVPTYEEPPTPDGTVTFLDQNLDRIIRELLGKVPEENITVGELEHITEIYADDSNISDLSGIQYCYNLRILQLTNSQITDISPLASLTNLLVLRLSNNQISDISPVGSLSNLQILNLQGNQVSDISPLIYHIQLHTVDLGHNNISDISTLYSLYGIMSLRLNHNQISDISSLVQNPGLDDGDGLSLSGNNLDLSEGSEDMQNIKKLEDRGVEVRYVEYDSSQLGKPEPTPPPQVPAPTPEPAPATPPEKAEPTHLVYYNNKELGISFHYPFEWGEVIDYIDYFVELTTEFEESKERTEEGKEAMENFVSAFENSRNYGHYLSFSNLDMDWAPHIRVTSPENMQSFISETNKNYASLPETIKERSSLRYLPLLGFWGSVVIIENPGLVDEIPILIRDIAALPEAASSEELVDKAPYVFILFANGIRYMHGPEEDAYAQISTYGGILNGITEIGREGFDVASRDYWDCILITSDGELIVYISFTLQSPESEMEELREKQLAQFIEFTKSITLLK